MRGAEELLAEQEAEPRFENPELLKQARDYQQLFRGEVEADDDPERRMAEIEEEIAATGTYRLTFAELEHGARVAWRNSTRCVGRHYWTSLELLDHRELTTAEEIFDALVDYLARATNGGRIQPTICVFAAQEPGRPGIRIWNEQLIRYAGYRRPDGSVLGDPRLVELTEQLFRLGWEKPEAERTPFDVLPVVIEIPGSPPRWFDLPPKAVLEVPIEHPDFPRFADLGVRWHALPSISNMRLEVGGISYTAAPFNGWYVGCEVGARNLADEQRYDLLPAMAEVMGIPAGRARDLWRDRALVELNLAVLHSFEKAGVRMVDHHTVCDHFVRFEDRERGDLRPVFADWAWVVPPLSGSTTPLFHRHYEDVELTPNYFYQSKPWEPEATTGDGDRAACPFHPGGGLRPAG